MSSLASFDAQICARRVSIMVQLGRQAYRQLVQPTTKQTSKRVGSSVGILVDIAQHSEWRDPWHCRYISLPGEEGLVTMRIPMITSEIQPSGSAS